MLIEEKFTDDDSTTEQKEDTCELLVSNNSKITNQNNFKKFLFEG
ncbi:unnamed protein product [Strongylus vulgaris]|uniref:Uncharacterized protein n=1 Tax=Strongylus vulgaris TaxID=40348 RepID=A0A3P7M215_STRVU|nr:unnamed protein product [Strongylus vulgaris]